MIRRTPVTAADLFVLLDREFRRRKPRDCNGCFIQLPYRVDSKESETPNWEMLPPPDCGNSCALVLEELLTEFQSLYSLTSPVGER